MRIYRYPGETKRLDAEVRALAHGSYVKLSNGITHYELTGPETGQVVVLIHGFSIPYQIWDPLFDPLVKAGFRVLRYDLYGRGTSDRPQVPYNQDLFDIQLEELLTVLRLTPPVDLIGLSMGGCVSVVFCDRHPDFVRKLVLIDPAGFSMNFPILVKLVTAPLLGELVFCLLGRKMFISSIAKGYYGEGQYPEYIDVAYQQMEFQGYRQALLSTLRNGVLSDNSGSYSRVGKQEKPSLLIWGTRDRAVPFHTNNKVREAIPQIEFHAVDNVGHVPHYECPSVVTPIILEFLRRE